MVKMTSGTLVRSFIADLPGEHGIWIKLEDYQSLQAALAEALNGWAQWYVNYPDPVEQQRIARLRKQFLDM